MNEGLVDLAQNFWNGDKDSENLAKVLLALVEKNSAVKHFFNFLSCESVNGKTVISREANKGKRNCDFFFIRRKTKKINFRLK